MVSVTITEKEVQMSSGPNRSLIHYLLVKPDIYLQDIGTAMLKMIIIQRDFVNHKIMAVTLLSQNYSDVVGCGRFSDLFPQV